MKDKTEKSCENISLLISNWTECLSRLTYGLARYDQRLNVQIKRIKNQLRFIQIPPTISHANFTRQWIASFVACSCCTSYRSWFLPLSKHTHPLASSPAEQSRQNVGMHADGDTSIRKSRTDKHVYCLVLSKCHMTPWHLRHSCQKFISNIRSRGQYGLGPSEKRTHV